MTSSNFSRLYKELCKKDVKIDSFAGKVYDPTYEREREEIFFDVGYEVGRNFPERIRGPRYHGKTVRQRRDNHMPHYSPPKVLTAHLDTNESRRRVERNKLLNLVTQDADNLKKVTNDLQEYVVNRKTIPSNLIDQLVNSTKYSSVKVTRHIENSLTIPKVKKIEKAREQISTHQTAKLPQISVSTLQDAELSPLSALKNPPMTNRRREYNISDKSSSTMKWSMEERERMNQIYLDMAQPSQKNNTKMWLIYLEGFAERYRSFFPSRSRKEVMEKARDMISKRKLKELGEPVFWKEVMTISEEQLMGSGASISNDEDITSTYKVYKRSGDEAYKIQMYDEAIYWYSQAIYSLKDDEAVELTTLAILFSNRSSAFLLNAQPIAALSDAERSIQLNPRWSKAYYRAAVACA
eukprot:gene24895-32433_t